MYNELHFEWDPIKAVLNKEKHNVSFEEAKTVFFEEKSLLISAPDHSSEEEDRFILPGVSAECHILLGCHCYREKDTIRLISARKANRKEARQYGERL